MRIAILGSGGVGGYFGGRLAATGTDVTFIARGAHLAALRERGLRIESPHGNIQVPRVSATDDPAEAGPVDIVFFTVKLYDTDAAARMLPPLLAWVESYYTRTDPRSYSFHRRLFDGFGGSRRELRELAGHGRAPDRRA